MDFSLGLSQCLSLAFLLAHYLKHLAKICSLNVVSSFAWMNNVYETRRIWLMTNEECAIYITTEHKYCNINRLILKLNHEQTNII
ncbi:hypothetical protein ACJW30_08G084700 [Castanea mollissima]